eukprot:TRINITY_DN5292_c2_g1_i1.p1 TRINITY_DN5292_c2_g1~~TRINITY_DN5292_c2_g1_i1.p1  ORF type:complete len:164 (+),score=24.91 TRINITY_DN5292_c2_g1_i1:189-680(+)
MATKRLVLQKIVSGGQTGVDRAGLDAAIHCRIPLGGWCPKGRRAQDGPIDSKYPLVETPKRNYQERTEWNVRDSSATLILVWEKVVQGGGTELTINFARKHGKPYLVVDVSQSDPTPDSLDRLNTFIISNNVSTLNIAGPREDPSFPVYEAAFSYLVQHLPHD